MPECQLPYDAAVLEAGGGRCHTRRVWRLGEGRNRAFNRDWQIRKPSRFVHNTPCTPARDVGRGAAGGGAPPQAATSRVRDRIVCTV